MTLIFNDRKTSKRVLSQPNVLTHMIFLCQRSLSECSLKRILDRYSKSFLVLVFSSLQSLELQFHLKVKLRRVSNFVE